MLHQLVNPLTRVAEIARYAARACIASDEIRAGVRTWLTVSRAHILVGNPWVGLLCLACFVQAAPPNKPRVAAIVAVMEAREAVSFPCFAAYTILDQRQGGTFWSNCSKGWVYQSDERIIRRRTTWRVGPGRSPFDKPSHWQVELIDAELAGSTPLYLTRKSPSPNTAWSGKTSSRMRILDEGTLVPAHFGLIWSGRRVSELMATYTVAVLDEVEWGGFKCLRVVVDVANPNGTPGGLPPSPDLFWLSKAHGYYPVRMVSGRRLDDAGPFSDKEGLSFEYNDREYGARRDLIVDELIQVSGVWFPVRAHSRVLFSGASGGTVTCTVDPASVRIGEVPSHLFALKEVERAVVADSVSGEQYFIGTHPYDVSKDRLEEMTLGSTEARLGLRRVSPPRGIPGWVYALIGVSALLGGVGIARAIRWRKNREGARQRSRAIVTLLVLACGGTAQAGEGDSQLHRASWIPLELEATTSMCAANCGFIALRDSGFPVDFDRLSRDLGARPDNDGVALVALRDALIERGLHVRVVSMSVSGVIQSGYSAIVFLGVPEQRVAGHYVLFRPQASGSGYEIVDPPHRLDSVPEQFPLDRRVPVLLYDIEPIPARPSPVAIGGMVLMLVGGTGVGLRLGGCGRSASRAGD